jgi:hypothetical protein
LAPLWQGRLPLPWLAEARALVEALRSADQALDRIAQILSAEAWRYDVAAAAPDPAAEREHLRAAQTLRQIIEAELAALAACGGASGERT